LLTEGYAGEGDFIWNSRDAGRDAFTFTDAFSASRITPKSGTDGIELRGAFVGVQGFYDVRDVSDQYSTSIF
jgi:hypothetical protein